MTDQMGICDRVSYEHKNFGSLCPNWRSTEPEPAGEGTCNWSTIPHEKDSSCDYWKPTGTKDPSGTVPVGTRVQYQGSITAYNGRYYYVESAKPEQAYFQVDDDPGGLSTDGHRYVLLAERDGDILYNVRRQSFAVLDNNFVAPLETDVVDEFKDYFGTLSTNEQMELLGDLLKMVI